MLKFIIEVLGFYLSYFSAAGRKQWFEEWDSIYTWGFEGCYRMQLKLQSMLQDSIYSSSNLKKPLCAVALHLTVWHLRECQ